MADARLKRPIDREVSAARREELYRMVATGEITVGEAVARMRRISRLTQEEFAKHRGISHDALRKIERDKANPTVQTLNKVAEIFNLQVGFVPLRKPS